MTTREFDRSFLTDELDLPYSFTDSEFVHESRWYDLRLGIFEFEGKHYGITYCDPKTEMQDDMDPFDLEGNTIEAHEMEQVEVVVKKWQPVKS